MRAFYNSWTRKEAYIKATGLGFSHSPEQVEVSFLPGEPAVLHSLSGDVEPASHWSISDIVLAPEFTAAIAVHKPRGSWVLSGWDWDGGLLMQQWV
jgi:4'-phosphopantetheinyl transferase